MFFPVSYDAITGWELAFHPAPLVIPRDQAVYEARRRADAVQP